jgi:uncharacterized protein YecT (DUF1311 family)
MHITHRPSCADALDTHSLPCWETAVAQSEINACASEEAKHAQAEMERVLAAIVSKRAGEKSFVRKLNAAQVAWLKYRDAELEARFPSDHPAANYGSVFPTCWRLEYARLFQLRTRALREWITGGAPQDLCNGSYTETAAD